ncbi:hypothetical protein SCH01S_49_00280 [Sphingomonas changbaiensis NBRC 104936]|uniref:Uncharacterized protein n=1 Tax=Sphingomonas changbaiensis NBRC 104936 TaxID=1219043 RepID=A0A0E9MSR6_9SPHN|nr:hypothetical protein [Sphingomonas changbaiensis]GAO40614.1 hypothetical protein SCH01S_49_00280 [Sphingomonas changbaiensis NBRC 104936]
MAYHFQAWDFESPAYTIEDHEAYIAAVTQAQVRAAHSYFHQHVLREDDGSYIVIDEGSYEPMIDWEDERIVCTILGGISDEF